MIGIQTLTLSEGPISFLTKKALFTIGKRIVRY